MEESKTHRHMTISEAKTLTFEFAQEMKMTKQQAISFSILALVEKGFTTQQAFTEVCGQQAWDMLGNASPEAILNAVQASF